MTHHTVHPQPTTARPTPPGAAELRPAAPPAAGPQPPPRPLLRWPAPQAGHRLLTARRRLRRTAAAGLLSALVVLAAASPAWADPPASLQEVIGRVTSWLVGLAAALATLFLTYGAVRYLTAGGDPGNVEKAKTALRSAGIGYGLALLAPLIVTVLASFVS